MPDHDPLLPATATATATASPGVALAASAPFAPAGCPVPAVISPMPADPGSSGRFGEFGGRFVPEALIPACEQLEHAFRQAWSDASFRAEVRAMLHGYAGRP